MKFAKFFADIKRVWKVTRKPTKSEYFRTMKIVLIGFLIVGFVGFLIEMLWELLLSHLF